MKVRGYGMFKEYRLNSDFMLRCVGDNSGMSVSVILISVPWLPVLEEFSGMTDKDEANRVFQELVRKYKYPLDIT